MQLRTAITPPRTENIAGETFAVHAHQHIRFAGDFAFDEGEVVLAVGVRAVKVQVKIAMFGRHFYHLDALDQPFPGAPVLDQILDRGQLQPVAAGKFQQIRQPRHRAVLAQNLADNGDGPAAGQLDQVHGRLGVARALQDPAGPRPQRNTWPGCTRSSGTAVGSAMTLMVRARSAALMPVVTPVAASTLTWKSV